MRQRRIMTAAIAVAAAAGVSALVWIAAAEMSASIAPAGSSTAVLIPATIHTQRAMIGGQTETVLIDPRGLPLYHDNLDIPTKSSVGGALEAFWPPLASPSPIITGVYGKLPVASDSNGPQIAGY
jgi:predicted lipoprotein with Yx(FWY)xxD motif